MNKEEIIKQIRNLLTELEKFKESLELEDHNFKINSDGWKKITVEGNEYLENPKKDIWELLGEEAKGEQLFTLKAMKRETKKAGKTVPTDEQFILLLHSKKDIPNLKLTGFRDTFGSFYNLSSNAYFWSSSLSGYDAWYRTLYASNTAVDRYAGGQALGFSVRCLKDNN